MVSPRRAKEIQELSQGMPPLPQLLSPRSSASAVVRAAREAADEWDRQSISPRPGFRSPRRRSNSATDLDELAHHVVDTNQEPSLMQKPPDPSPVDQQVEAMRGGRDKEMLPEEVAEDIKEEQKTGVGAAPMTKANMRRALTPSLIQAVCKKRERATINVDWERRFVSTELSAPEVKTMMRYSHTLPERGVLVWLWLL